MFQENELSHDRPQHTLVVGMMHVWLIKGYNNMVSAVWSEEQLYLATG
jgi:hypothetical protein